MTRLNQIIAVEAGVKGAAHSEITRLHHDAQKTAPLAGISRTYTPRDDEGEQLPGESVRVQIKADDLLRQLSGALSRFFDVTATKDWANCAASADVVVDDQALLEAVPVTYLLFLEKQLTDLHTFAKKLPTLDPSESWSYDSAAGCYATEPVQTTRTKKVPRNHVKAEATDKHPAQVEVYTEDVVVGYWRTVKFSGALPAERVAELVERVEKLQRAVKFAREEANSGEVTDQRVGAAVFGYLFA